MDDELDGDYDPEEDSDLESVWLEEEFAATRVELRNRERSLATMAQELERADRVISNWWLWFDNYCPRCRVCQCFGNRM